MNEKEKGPLPYYPWYVTRYRAHRKVQRMNHVERGIYRELLDECWEEGTIPDDINRLAEIARCPVGVMAEAWPNIRVCFTPTEGLDGIYMESPRLEQIRTQQDEFRLKQAQRRKGAKATAVNRGQPRLTTRLTIDSKEKDRKVVTGCAETFEVDAAPPAPHGAARLADGLPALMAKAGSGEFPKAGPR